MYSSDQQKVMDVVIATHGGGQQVEASGATGLRKLNLDLDAERGTVSTERAAAVKAAEAARVEMRDSQVKRDESQARYDEHKANLDSVRRDAKELKAKADELSAILNKSLAKVGSAAELDVDAGSEAGEVLNRIREYVENEKKEMETLNEELAVHQEARAKATDELAQLRVELNRLTAINEKFFTDYTKNSDEFPLLAVDTRWKFVVFNVGPDSGLIPGDATPLLVKRGGAVITTLRIVSISKGTVVAEYDPKKLTPGVRPEVGDRVFRVKPLGS